MKEKESNLKGRIKNNIRNMIIPFPCPVCGNLVTTEEICEVCGWQNTGPVNIDGGPNIMTLEEARKAYVEGKPIK